MSYIHRTAETLVRTYAGTFPVVGVAGPRQSGKSTMLKHMFDNEYAYVTFDDFQVRQLFYDDPVKFMHSWPGKTIFDEAQYVPEIFPIIKMAVDSERERYGRFILTGSGQFLLNSHISESLAGRIGMVPLLPFQYTEIPEKIRDKAIFKGGFPELAVRGYRNDDLWFKAYFETYLQKDLRQMINIPDLHSFTLFVRLLAVNIGQILNLSSFSREIGVAVNTLKRWLSVLESSYIVFLLNPYYMNLGKRMVKSPKIYFYDSGMAAFLAGIGDRADWERSLLHGPLFENFIISEILKAKFHMGFRYELYFIRSNHGDEIDLMVENRNERTLLEIKASQTYRPQFHNMLSKYLSAAARGYVIYQGEQRTLDSNLFVENYADFLSALQDMPFA